MIEIEPIISWLKDLPPVSIYAMLWLTTYIENIFPPSPSDVVLLFIATLVGIGTIDLVPAIAVATIGSVSGFLTAFLIGRQFGRKIVETNKLPFLTTKALTKVDHWFDRYGYWVIIANRFLAGTRAVISFFAGMSNLKLLRTTILCAVSALAWNTIIIVLGKFLGDNWQYGQEILRQYGLIVTGLLVAIVLFFLVRWLVRRKTKSVES